MPRENYAISLTSALTDFVNDMCHFRREVEIDCRMKQYRKMGMHNTVIAGETRRNKFHFWLVFNASSKAHVATSKVLMNAVTLFSETLADEENYFADCSSDDN